MRAEPRPTLRPLPVRPLEHPLAEPIPEGLEVVSLDDLLAHRWCRRLGVWQARGLVKAFDPDPRVKMLPSPWPSHPPGFTGAARSWPRAVLDGTPENVVWGCCDWLLDLDGRPGVVLLGNDSATLRGRAGLMLALLAMRGNDPKGARRQPFPPSWIPDSWLGDWPALVPLHPPPSPPWTLQVALQRLRQDLEGLQPPPATAQRARCYDCSGMPWCGDRC